MYVFIAEIHHRTNAEQKGNNWICTTVLFNVTLDIESVQYVQTEIIGQIRFYFNVVFDLSGSRGKWSLSDVSLIVSWQLLFTQRFNCCYCCSWFNVWLHHRYFKGCCPYTRWDFEMNKCVGKLLKIWKNTIFYLYSLYLQITSYLADIVFKHFPIASIFIS